MALAWQRACLPARAPGASFDHRLLSTQGLAATPLGQLCVEVHPLLPLQVAARSPGRPAPHTWSSACGLGGLHRLRCVLLLLLLQPLLLLLLLLLQPLLLLLMLRDKQTARSSSTRCTLQPSCTPPPTQYAPSPLRDCL